MKKLTEKVILTFCYVVTIIASIRMYANLIADTEKLTMSVVFNLVIVGLGLVFLSVMAFILLFTKRPND
jgi:hypothetical protein